MKTKRIFFSLLIVIFVMTFTVCEELSQLQGTTGTIIGFAKYSNGSDNSDITITLEKTENGRSVSVIEISSGTLSMGSRVIADQTSPETDGMFTLYNVPVGTYTLYASSKNSQEKAVKTDVTVTANQVFNAGTLNLTPVGSVSGKIIVTDGGKNAAMGFLVSIAGTSFMAMTDMNGLFEISGIPAKAGYFIIISKGIYTALYPDTDDPKSITVTAGGNFVLDDIIIDKEELSIGSDITIGDNGNWFINGVDTGKKAQGEKGESGNNIFIDEDGYLWVDGKNTGVKVPVCRCEDEECDCECWDDCGPHCFGCLDLADLFTNHTDFSIKFTNYSNSALIAFKNDIHPDNIIGGIPAGTVNHGLKNDPVLFPSSPQQFRILFITEQQFYNNKDNLNAIANDFLTQIIIFWNGVAGSNDNVYEISDRLGGNYQIIISNPSNVFNVELRVNSPSGPLLGFVPVGAFNTRFYVGMGEYMIFPVFKYFNPHREIVETVFPVRNAPQTGPWRITLMFDDYYFEPQEINLANALSGFASRRSTGQAYIIIYNNTGSGAISFIKGTTLQLTAVGTNAWSSGNQREFPIQMPYVGGSHGFASEFQVSDYRIRQGGHFVQITTVDGNSSSFTVKADMSYYVYVTGDTNAGEELSAKIETREGEPNGPFPLYFTPLF